MQILRVGNRIVNPTTGQVTYEKFDVSKVPPHLEKDIWLRLFLKERCKFLKECKKRMALLSKEVATLKERHAKLKERIEVLEREKNK